MARSNFGGGLTDFAIRPPSGQSGVVKSQPNIATGTFWSAKTGGTQHTDLLDSVGAPTSVVRTDTDGFIQAFQGPDGVAEGWVDLGSGSRFHLRSVDGFAPKSFLGITVPSVLNDITALQAAADSCATSGNRLVAGGTIVTATTLVIKSDADIGSLLWTYTGTSGTGITCGDASGALFAKTVKLPRNLTASAKTATGWAQVAGTVGVDVVNCYGWTIHIPKVTNFETGLQLRGASSNGSQQTNIHLGHLDNNKRNIVFTGSATGWANQNTIFGGRCSHASNEGSQVAGTRHILFENIANPVNGNATIGTSLESPDVVEFHVEWANTQNTTLVNPRWENTGGSTHRRTKSTGNSKGNIIIGGAYSDDIDQSANTSPALPVDVIHPGRTTLHGGTASVATLLLENVFSSTAPILYTMAAGAGAAGDDPATKYATKLTANTWAGKRSTDTAGNDRVILDWQNGRLYVGDATAAPVGFIGGSASTVFVGGSLPFAPLANNTQDCGLTSLKWRYVRAGTAVQTGAVATGSRPAAATAGAGAMVFDTTLGKPIWSTGSAWVDATGATV